VPAARAILAEDEPLLREELAELLARLWPELAIVAQTADGIATLQALEKHGPDILFLDINMPGMSGVEVARQASGRCHVVFVTAYDQHTLAAFEQGAADYLHAKGLWGLHGPKEVSMEMARNGGAILGLLDSIGDPLSRNRCSHFARGGYGFGD